MLGQRWILGAVLTGLAWIAVPATAKAAAPANDKVKIGIVQTLFKDVPDTLVSLMAQPFNTLMATQTGMKGDMTKSGDALTLGKELVEQKVQLGIFLGYEFGWAKQQYPELEPLMIVVNQHQQLRAFLVIRGDQELASWADLKEQTLTLGRGTRPHCHMFLDKRCQDHCQCAPGDLCKVANASSAEEALDDVVDGVARATVVDGVVLEGYQRRKPGRFAQLKVFAESEVFPAAVVAHKPGALTANQIERFKNGMVTAHQNALGRQLLTLWKVTGFNPVPAGFDQVVKDIVASYPPPVVVPVLDDAKAIEDLIGDGPKPAEESKP